MAKNPHHLPEDILLEIFSRLPAKSVGKFRCLSKSWRSNLCTTQFVHKHLITRQKTIQQQHVALLSESGSLEVVSLSLKQDDLQFNTWTSLRGKRFHHLYDACNGLILTGNHFRYLFGEDVEWLSLVLGGIELELVNPITLQHSTIPPPPYEISRLYPSVGLGYDSSSDDYKLIQISFSGKNDHTNTYIDVYSVKRGVWYRLDVSFPYDESDMGSAGGVFANGAVHWILKQRKGGMPVGTHIAAFDLANEIFRVIAVPAIFSSTWSCVFNELNVVSGYLTIFCTLSDSTEVWMMKEYGVVDSWVKLNIGINNAANLLCFIGDEQLLCCTHTDLVMCDLKDGTSKECVIDGNPTLMNYPTISFVDSLVSPGKPECDIPEET